MICDQKQSLQQMIYNLYTTLHLTQLKGFSIMQFSWMLLQTHGKGMIFYFTLQCMYLKKNFKYNNNNFLYYYF